MKISKERLDAAKKRILSRYPDRDEVEAKAIESFKDLTPEQVRNNFIRAVKERKLKLEEETLRRLRNDQ